MRLCHIDEPGSLGRVLRLAGIPIAYDDCRTLVDLLMRVGRADDLVAAASIEQGIAQDSLSLLLLPRSGERSSGCWTTRRPASWSCAVCCFVNGRPDRPECGKVRVRHLCDARIGRVSTTHRSGAPREPGSLA